MFLFPALLPPLGGRFELGLAFAIGWLLRGQTGPRYPYASERTR
jgi:hypothetical protein